MDGGEAGRYSAGSVIAHVSMVARFVPAARAGPRFSAVRSKARRRRPARARRAGRQPCPAPARRAKKGPIGPREGA
ncbi:hypothetical protein HMPREF0972_01682 [Actinomyces sp. oral taxon 848 str. F0332]|nr:hypothetical protein HMPREF0972_01682 [Actinomyces sp. oral taxon 848 str. F0332]